MNMVTFSGLMRLPLKYVYFILPFSFSLMCLHIVNTMLQNTWKYIKARKGGQQTWN